MTSVRGAPEPCPGRPPDGRRLRVRLHRTAGRRLRGLAHVRAVLRLPLRRRAHPAQGQAPERRPVSPPARRPPVRDRPHRDLPDRPGSCVPPGALGGRRACGVRGRRALPTRLPGARQRQYILGISAIGLLVLPALPGIGRTINGATLWVDIGPIVFQPGELAKVLIVIFLAGYLRDNREMLSYGAGGGRLPPQAPRAAPADLGRRHARPLPDARPGRRALYFAIFLVMLYTATARWSFVAVGIGLFLAGAVALYQVIPHVQTRVQGWLDPWSDPQGDTYQLVQSIYAISSGGVFGSGLGTASCSHPRATRTSRSSRPTSSSRRSPRSSASPERQRSSSSTSSSPSAAFASRCSPTTGSPSSSRRG